MEEERKGKGLGEVEKVERRLGEKGGGLLGRLAGDGEKGLSVKMK